MNIGTTGLKLETIKGTTNIFCYTYIFPQIVKLKVTTNDAKKLLYVTQPILIVEDLNLSKYSGGRVA